jgi:hypothetical protein
MRPILLHCGHFVWSPMLTMFLIPLSFCYPCRFSFPLSF